MRGRQWQRLEGVLVLGIVAGAATMLAAGPRLDAAGEGARVTMRPLQLNAQRVPAERLNGVVVPSSLMRVQLSARPKLKVWNGQGGEFNFYQGDAFIDWNRGDVKWRFQWTDAGPGARAVWQVCRFDPHAAAANWKEPPGLMASGDVNEVPAKGATGSFTIDFAAFAPKPPKKAPQSAAPAPTGRLTLAPRAAMRATPTPSATAARSTGAMTMQASQLAHVGLRLAGNPWTYYVRVVVLNAKGEPTGAISTSVAVHYGEPAPSDLKLPPPGPAPQPPADPRRPVVTILEYEPIRPQAADATEWFLVTQNFGMWKKGQTLHLTPKEPDAWDKIGDAVGGVVGFFEDAVNWVATAYEDIKKTAVNAVASSIPGCGGACRDVLAYGLDTGLAACGLPPDLPNFDELVEMGKGNLAATLVAQAGLADVPLSDELARQMMDKIAEQAASAANNGPSGNQFMRPLPDKQFRPAFVRVRITNPAGAGRRDAGLDFLAWDLYRERYVPVPRLKPGESREVTVFLEPDYSSWERKYLLEHGGMAAGDSDMRAGWEDLYYEGEADMLASVTSWPQGDVNVVSGKPVQAGLQGSGYIKQRPVQTYHGK